MNFNVLLVRLYYQYIPEGKEYPVLCRKLEDTKRSGWLNTFLLRSGIARLEREEVLLDWNELAEKYGELPFYFIFHVLYFHWHSYSDGLLTESVRFQITASTIVEM